MLGPHVGRIARPGAERDDRSPDGPRRLQDPCEARPHGQPRLRIGVRHVVGAGERGKRHAQPFGSGTAGGERAFVKRAGQAVHPEARKVHLRAAEPVGADGLQHLFHVPDGIGAREDRRIHQTGPDTLARSTGLPVFADSAIATMPRTEATPSSIEAPFIGMPFITTSAKASTCRR